jgi:hypothetical protein
MRKGRKNEEEEKKKKDQGQNEGGIREE